MEIRLTDGTVVSEREFRNNYPNTSFPKVLLASTLADYGVAVLEAPQPAHDPRTHSIRRNGVVQDGLGNWVQAWGVEALSAQQIAEKLASAKSAFIRQVDTDTDALIRAVIGERASEYERAEKEAVAFAGGGYLGTAPGSVSAWATAKGWTDQAAADDIVATATAWRAAQAAIRSNRLARKEAARNAVDMAALDVVKVQWAGFLTLFRGQLGL